MRRILSWFALAPIALLLLCALQPAGAQPAPAEERAAIAATWRGTWTGHGYVYDAESRLTVRPDKSVDGTFAWTLRQTPPGSGLAGKIGRSGTEYVRGRYLPMGRVLQLEGYKTDDPDGIIAGVGKYRLVLADDYSVIGGITSDTLDWSGQLLLTR
jgi:hypothetical protein